MRYLNALKIWPKEREAILSKSKWDQKCKCSPPVFRTGYSERAVTALQSFSDSSATGIIFVDMSEHADCGVERRHFSPSKLRLCFSVFLSWCWCLILMHKLYLKICPSGTHSSAPSVGCRASVICLTLKSPWCLHSTCQSGGRIMSQRRKGKIW